MKNKTRYLISLLVMISMFVLGRLGWTEVEVMAFSSATRSNATQSNATLSNATLSNATMVFNLLSVSATGDLWENWNGDSAWDGDGTEEKPYQIDNLSDLMGLSEMVAMGNDYQDIYFELTTNITLQDDWNPIGWYQNESDFGSEVSTPFSGHFDGAGNTIRGLEIDSDQYELDNIGLFGVMKGGSIKNLVVEAEYVSGGDNVAILVGAASDETFIKDVEVEGSIIANGDAGGIIGEGSDGVVIEYAQVKVSINSEDSYGYVGGIGGNMEEATVVDSQVLTYDGDANRIQGKGYVGGILGRMSDTRVFNVYVDGTIGGNDGRAIGGIIGKYESGDLMVARFAGTIGKSNQGSASREGTFIGTRDTNHNFTYGVDTNDNFAYLFTTDGGMAKVVCGSNVDGDNDFTTDAHIGYWTSNQRQCYLVAGNAETEVDDKFFYEELEEGIQLLTTMKLSENEVFTLDHFAPNAYGAPIRGYLVSIPRIDTKNENGTYDTDVATLSAIGQTTNAYYQVIDKNNPSAVAPGDTVCVTTAAKNDGDNRYQMVYDETEPGKVQPPTYVNEQGNTIDMTYVEGGTYTFVMPECDTELNVAYEKVTTQLTMTPTETTISIVQTREGDRKNPEVTTRVYDEQGRQIASYIGSESLVTPDAISIHAEHNGEGSTVDKTVKWSVDNPDLITLVDVESGYTEKDAYVTVNMSSTWLQGILEKQLTDQINNQYLTRIDNTIYKSVAVVTATTNPNTSSNYVAVVGNTTVTVAFQILDETTRRVEGIQLNQEELTLTLTRQLTGSRTNPQETYVVSNPFVLEATLIPENPEQKIVTWTNLDLGGFITMVPTGEFGQECEVEIVCNLNGENNPAWIQNIINADNLMKVSDSKLLLQGNAQKVGTISVTSADQTYGVISKNCVVTLNFVTDDQTTVYSSSSGGSSGGGGSSSGTSTVSTTNVAGGPAVIQIASWIQNEDETWSCMGQERQLQNEWCYLENPFAQENQEIASWFYFNELGVMVTGVFVDIDRHIYYLNPVSDGCLGMMLIGWHQINGNWYYFSENTTEWNPKGSLVRSGITPDGYVVDENGIRMEEE